MRSVASGSKIPTHFSACRAYFAQKRSISTGAALGALKAAQRPLDNLRTSVRQRLQPVFQCF